MMDLAASTNDAADAEPVDLGGPRPVVSPIGVRIVQFSLVAILALSLPIAGIAVFGFNADRGTVANALSIAILAGMLGLLISPWLPFRLQKTKTRFERIQSMVLIWFGITYTSHMTWEFTWLVLHNKIRSSRGSAWAYPWWAYIDGGDTRYATSNPTLLAQETLAVTAGFIAIWALLRRFRTRGSSAGATMTLMCLASAELLSTMIYFGSEVFGRFPNVNTSNPIDLWIKFWGLNGIWLVMPWVVIFWGSKILRSQLGISTSLQVR